MTFKIFDVSRFLILFLFASFNSFAGEAGSPVELLKNTSDTVIKILKDEKETLKKDEQRVYEIIDQHILPLLDQVTMAKLALGKNWRKANDQERVEFVGEFKDLLVRTYSKSLQEFSDQKINFFPLKVPDNEKRVTVKSEVLQSGGPTIPVDYRMRLKDSAWKVYDIKIDGVSLVTSYRGTFSQEIRKGGMAGLLKLLKDKNSKIEPDKKPA